MSRDSYCGICGKKWSYSHRCSTTVLHAIDAANTRAKNNENEPTSPEPFYRTKAYRINEGLYMLRDYRRG